MARDHHGNSIDNLETCLIVDPNYDLHGLFENSWSLPGKSDELAFNSELNALAHSGSVPPILVNGDSSVDSYSYNGTISPASLTDHYFDSPIQELPNGSGWGELSFHSDATYHMRRSVSISGTVDTMMSDQWNDGMMASPTHLHPHSLPNNFELELYEPANKAESVSSGDSFTEQMGETTNSTSLTIYQVSRDGSTGSLVTNATAGGRRPRGRRGHLNAVQREGAAKMRKVGACKMCNIRKAKCDGTNHTVYCGACIKYWRGKGKRPPQPCRGSEPAFQNIAEVILRGHVFPRHRPLSQYLGEKFEVENETHPILLSFGFGAPFQANIKLIKTADSDKLVHRHIVYPWQPEANVPSKKKSPTNYVFNAILADTDKLPKDLECHIERLLDDESSFAQFPLFKSEFQILWHIWFYYRDLPKNPPSIMDGRTMLRQALKLLILIHVGGDTKLDEGCRSLSHEIIAQTFPAIEDSEPVIATPCFIRGQMGPYLAEIAKTLMRDVLKRIEDLSLTPENCQYFPVVLSTFAVLFMAMESIQYHAAKESYHALYDSDAVRAGERQQALANEEEGVKNLLKFYADCFGDYHAKLHDHSASTFQHFTTTTATKSASGGDSERDRTIAYLRELKGAVDRARKYLIAKRDSTVAITRENVGKGDMSAYFDRLLAKLFLVRA